MGACYSCNGCGKCASPKSDYKNTCPMCHTVFKEGEAVCSSCGNPLPLPPGAVK